MIFALIGNQNCGKTTLFNQLTGSNQHVGNFPGVTVDQKMGEIHTKSGQEGSVVDLPGIYSLRPYTNEEIVTRDFLLNEKPDGIINIVDATNIERNLYLTLQLIDLHIPMVLALNMMDEVRNNGGSINIKKMSEQLGIPVIPISAIKNEGVEELVHTAFRVAQNKEYPKVYDFCEPGPIHRCIHGLCHQVEDHAKKLGMNARFAAVKLIEGDEGVIWRLKLSQNEMDMIEHSIIEMEKDSGLDRNAALAEMRYTFIEKLCKDTVVKCQISKEYLRSQRIDSVLTNRYLALPVFAAIMIFIFWMTFGSVGAFLSDYLSAGIDKLAGWVDYGLTVYGINPVVKSLVVDGVFSGVGSVLSFLPIILVLFFFLSILEDSGYMARIAFVMDTLLRKIGLSGRSFVPMLIGFGCSVPAVMSSRTLYSERDRNMTIMLVPYISCSAKIPIYTVFTAAFFPNHGVLVMALLYFGGMAVGVLMALIFKKLLFRGKPMPFVMELPNYRFPSAKSVLLLMWEKARDFIERAFTIIFVATIIIWFLQTFDAQLNVAADSAHSLLAMIGQWLAPVFAPLGFSDWRISTALITGISAKETVVSTLSVLLGTSASGVAGAIGQLFTPLSAASFLVFTLLYTPCVAAIAAIHREMNSTLRTVGVVVLQCVVAWIMALIVYHVGGLFF
ncbi:MAG TPA: ferrous iron transport protein B [Candidatus Anaerobutyricum faecale]|uniref:ferrous iron transport protein B n=1 Tax=Eubacterium sp. An11 TaxID=1965542 RepID=UPI000B39E511|nr:ferrous iron transport protein B [Eubacterium sp. An11]OUQ65453.1 ferrous iron transport protein B [Eubacterium sp. An11]HJC31407.1 ferrous iron transport protein B [Candidatus Anaerobutyricum faecale]